MQVLLLGATGRTGKYVLDLLLNEGYDVNILVRDRNKIQFSSGRLQIFEGDPMNKQILFKAMNGCQAAISVLNISRVSDFPWSKLRTGKTFLSNSMLNILDVSKEAHLNRIIVCSAWGVHETKKDIPVWFRWIINNSNVGVTYKDHERQEDLLTQSEMNYTIVRPVGLTNSTSESKIQISKDNNPKPKLLISRKNTAKFIVQLLKDSSYSRQTITISNK